MNAAKQKSLDEAFDRIMQVCIYNMDAPLEWIDQYISPSVTGFGTEFDEEIHHLEDCRRLVLKAREQSAGLDFKASGQVIHVHISPGEDAVIYVQQIQVQLTVNGELMTRGLRMSLIMKFENGKWMMTHFHGSAPETGTTINDTFHVDQWKTKMAELEKLVAEKTADLAQRNRELEIEAALERVRAVAMGMKEPTDMLDMCKVIVEELKRLSIGGIKLVETVVINENHDFFLDYEYYSDSDYRIVETFRYRENELILQMVNTILQSEDSFYYGGKIEGVLKAEWFSYMKTSGYYVAPELLAANEVHYHFYSVGQAALGLVTDHGLSDEEFQLYKRLRNVFALAYRRYRDIEQAEQQAKEAKIEAGLERVRSAANAMKTSEELLQVITVVGQQLENLGLQFDSTNFRTNVGEKDWRLWIYAKWMDRPRQWVIPRIEHPYFSVEEKQGDVVSSVFSREEKNSFDAYLLQLGLIEIPKDPEVAANQKAFMEAAKGFAWSIATIKSVSLNIANSQAKPYTLEENAMLLRFAVAFEQAYTRFLDLQLAETQAREAEIELALERVRARTMAMQKSDELPETSYLLFQQMAVFGETAIQNSIAIVNEEEGFVELSTTVQGNLVPKPLHVPTDDPHVMAKAVAAWKNRQKSLTIQIQGEELKEYNELRNSFLETRFSFPEDNWIVNIAFFSKGWLSFSSNYPISEESVEVLGRFAFVFEQTYTRFLDLQKAEQQAREAEIQLSLERVRARTMAMQRSEELTDTTKLLFDEFKSLQSEKDPLILSRGFITIVNEPDQRFDLWITDIDGSEIRNFFRIDFIEPTQGQHLYKAWKAKQPSIIIDHSGEQLDQWLDYLVSVGFPVAQGIYGTRRINSCVYHTNGFIGITSSSPVSDEGMELLERFARVFDLTYTRFTDLLQSETRARLAVRDASLNRVRAEIASMRTTEDLQRITPVLWRELSSLSIPFIRCGVFIMDEEASQMHCFLSTPEGKSITSFELPFTSEGNFSEVLLHWRNKQSYVVHWQQNDFSGIAETLLRQGRITNEQQYLGTLPADGIHLHFLPFLQGMLYVGNTIRLSEQELDLIQSLAESFSTAYARYEDFNRLELAKKEVEATLAELKQAQQQLIQSEKMASLGELTAGIAHEIQNPLNFVNNFSEVSNELIDEMKEEFAGGKYKEGLEIADDIKANLSKINHHGKRADAIVKAMLQHSRLGSGKKEPTDLNALCDEYLRLAYHGYRAKDKSFNAQYDFYPDPLMPQLNVMIQDIGRVILNLINNAFYAVDEKARIQTSSVSPSYYPKISVTTKHVGNQVEISIKDNGNGIARKIIDKIFQPFFTTKPTGQGTGLGLSLSYDIVKAHGGEIKVETKEGEGTVFVISLPAII